MKKRDTRRGLARLFELPDDALGKAPCLALRGGVMTLWQCGEILCYEDGLIILTLLSVGGERYKAEITGSRLYMRSFLDGTVEVEGTITEFRLEKLK